VIKTLHEISPADIKGKPHKRRVSNGKCLDVCIFEKEFHKTEEKIMTNLKKLIVVISLTLVLAATALADGPTPPCPNPGEMNAPPCSASQLDAEDSGNQTGSTISSEVDTLTIATAISAIESLLTVY